MGRVPVSVGPGLLASQHRAGVGQTLDRDQPFEGGQPVVIITGAVVGLATILCGFQLGGQRRGPFFPRKVTLLGKPDG